MLNNLTILQQSVAYKSVEAITCLDLPALDTRSVPSATAGEAHDILASASLEAAFDYWFIRSSVL